MSLFETLSSHQHAVRGKIESIELSQDQPDNPTVQIKLEGIEDTYQLYVDDLDRDRAIWLTIIGDDVEINPSSDGFILFPERNFQNRSLEDRLMAG